MVPEWVRRVFRGLRSQPKTTTPSAPSPPTPREQWTVIGVYFDTRGWSLVQSSPTSMTWTGDQGGELTLHEESGSATALQINVAAARREHRARAAAADGGIVSVEYVNMPAGGVALEVVTKRRHGLGSAFEGVLVFREAGSEYTVRIGAPETLTGAREALVSSHMLQLGEIDMSDVMSERPGPTGGRTVKGLSNDPYDPAFDGDATHGVSDDPRLDVLFPAHPLTIIRTTLMRARSTWESGTVRPSAVDDRAALPESSGPRSLLSDAALREIYWSLGRNDLLEIELQAAISAAESAGASSDVRFARLLMMLGVVQHNSQNVLKASAVLRRAVTVLTAAVGDQDRETGVALELLGRTQERLGKPLEAERSFRSAITILERHNVVGMHLIQATALLGTILVDQNRTEEAAPLVERAQQLAAQFDASEGPDLLRAVVGGAPRAYKTRIKTLH